MFKIIEKIDNLLFHKLSKYSNNLLVTIVSRSGNIIIIICIIILFYFLPIKDNREIAIISLISLIINTIVVFIIKYSVRKKRFVQSKYFFDKFDPYSFPSGHVSRLSGFIFVTSSIPILPIIFIVLALVIGIARMIKGYHSFSDCFVGFIIGLTSGFIVKILSFIYLLL